MDVEKWRQIEALYHAALDCDGPKRSRLLDAADPAIRTEVELLLIQDGSLLDEPAWAHLNHAPKFELSDDRYEIETLLGSGGMGDVFRARDKRLGRFVAIKTSHARFSDRFEHEARAISALNHPCICTLYDVGPDYLVMELIEGETLASRLKRGKLPVAEVLQLGRQIADALAEAHSNQIVHQDLKPSNIMLTRHGVKVLDFGLARLLSEGGETGAPVMGTPAYMAPEQVEGRPSTAGTDLFAFGLALYEMTTGRLPNPGHSLGRLLAADSATPVPAPSAFATVPAAFDRLVLRLLNRRPERRPTSARAVSLEIANLSRDSAGVPHKAAAIGLLAFALITVMTAWMIRKDVGMPKLVSSPSYTQITSFTDAAVGPVLSRDGRTLAFYRSDNSFLTSDQIWVKRLPDGEPYPVTADKRPKYGIAFSPDGTHLAYTVMDNLFHTVTISLSSPGQPQLFRANSAGLSWLDDRHILFSQIKSGIHMGIVTSRIDGSDFREIYFPRQDRAMAHYSYLSPDRKWILLAEMDPEWHRCRLVSFDGKAPARDVGPPGACTSVAWSPDGSSMYFAANVSGRRHLWRQRFPDGQPEQITSGSNEEDGIAMAENGRSLITSVSNRQSTVWIHKDDTDRALSTEGYASKTPLKVSADGKRVYYLLRHDSPESPAELWRTDINSERSEAMTAGMSIRDFDLSQDEREVVFSTEAHSTDASLWIAPLDRSSSPRKIVTSGVAGSPHFFKNGEIVFRLSQGNTYYAAAIRKDGRHERRLLPYPILDLPSVSPDGKVIIINAPFPLTEHLDDRPTLAVSLSDGSRHQICAGLCSVNWSPNGRNFYVEISSGSLEHPGGKTVVIPITPGETLPSFPATARNPQDWLNAPNAQTVNFGGIAPSPNPSLFAYIKPTIHANLFRIQIN